MLTFGLTGVVLLLSVHSDPRVPFLGGALLLSACAFSNSGAPGGLSLILRHIRPEFFAPYFLWMFALRFPTARTFDPYLRVGRSFARLTFITALTLFCLSGIALLILIADPLTTTWLRPLEQSLIQGFGWTLVLVLQLPALALMIRRSRMAPLPERRRVRLFLGSLIGGTLPLTLIITADLLIPSFSAYFRTHRTPFNLVVYSSMGVTPLIIAYSVLVQRILDVRLIVRKALQYAMARYTLAAISLLPLGVLAVFVYQRRFQPLDQLLRGTEALVLLGTAVAGLGTIKARKRVLDVLDRRFFREQYDARLILAGVVAEIRSARSMEEMGDILHNQIRKALAPETAATFIMHPSSHAFTPLHSGMEPIPSGSDLGAMIINSKEPLDTDLEDANGSVQTLPREERQWLAVGGIRLIVPIHGSKEHIHGFIALGARRNELPYTSEDRLLLTTISNSAGLVLDVGLADAGRTKGILPADEQAVLCSACGILLPETHTFCTLCSGTVSPANVPYILLEKFRLERRLGAGGMGVVYRAMDLTLKRTVAVKTLPTVSPEHAIQLRREARAMASVSHPNLALIFGAETWHGKPLLIVEYMSAGTLADRLSRGAVPPLEAAKTGLQLAEVLDHLHSAGILHRDVKPSNIGFIAPDVPKLLDFGLAQLLPEQRILRGRTATSWNDEETIDASADRTVTAYTPVLAGTPAYMSPEVVRGADPDPSFDLWALALVIYESITLQNPMKKADVGLTLKEVAAGRVPDARKLFPSCPDSLAEFLVSALSSDPRHRPKSARDFHTRLEAAARRAA